MAWTARPEVLSGAWAGTRPRRQPGSALWGSCLKLPADRYLDRGGRRAGCGSASGCSSSPRTRTCRSLERVRFESIFASALDEFFMVRVGRPDPSDGDRACRLRGVSGKAPDQILENTLDLARELADRHARCFRPTGLLPTLG